MPSLHWIGKEKVINHHHQVPFRVLNHEYGFDGERGTDREYVTSTGNKIIHGDNLEALKPLLPEFEGRVKCIYCTRDIRTKKTRKRRPSYYQEKATEVAFFI